MGITHSIEKTKSTLQSTVQEEITKRLMLQREIQMAVNVAKARDIIHIFGSAWMLLVSGVSIAKVMKKPVPPVVAVPIFAGGLMLGNMADMAYGNKLARINKEAAYLLEQERSRFVPFPQVPFAKYYTTEERSMFYDLATPVGELGPFSVFARGFTPRREPRNEKS